MKNTKKGVYHVVNTPINNTSLEPDSVIPTEPLQHSFWHSLWLHLLPGMLILLFTLISEPILIRAGLPLLLLPSLWVLVVLIPFELGYLLFQAKKRNGTFSLHGNEVLHLERSV